MLLTLTIIVTALDFLLVLGAGIAYWRRTRRLPVSMRAGDRASTFYVLLMGGGTLLALAFQLAYMLATRPNQ